MRLIAPRCRPASPAPRLLSSKCDIDACWFRQPAPTFFVRDPTLRSQILQCLFSRGHARKQQAQEAHDGCEARDQRGLGVGVRESPDDSMFCSHVEPPFIKSARLMELTGGTGGGNI